MSLFARDSSTSILCPWSASWGTTSIIFRVQKLIWLIMLYMAIVNYLGVVHIFREANCLVDYLAKHTCNRSWAGRWRLGPAEADQGELVWRHASPSCYRFDVLWTGHERSNHSWVALALPCERPHYLAGESYLVNHLTYDESSIMTHSSYGQFLPHVGGPASFMYFSRYVDDLLCFIYFISIGDITPFGRVMLIGLFYT